MSKVHTYEGKDVDVSWDGRLCIHIGECGRSDDAMFVSGRKPWCNPDLVELGQALDVVTRCPTGALSYQRKDGAPGEQAPQHNRVVVANNGPLYLTGDLAISGGGEDQPGVSFRAALCRCGLSKNKPFCDNSHEAGGFIDRGAVGKSGDGCDGPGGQLAVKPAPNGPLLLQGNFEIVSGSGRTAWRGTTAALCRCGQSKNKPFCDGAHRDAGFTAG